MYFEREHSVVSEIQRITLRLRVSIRDEYLWKATLLGFFVLASLLQGKVFSQNIPELPKPTGQFGIGRIVLDWTDPSRSESMSGRVGEHRELLVYLFYPIDKTTDGRRAVYFPHQKETEAFEEQFGKNFFQKSYGNSYPALSIMRTHTIENAKLAPVNNKYPILIFSHGGGIRVLFYSAIIEDLVSHGYVVAAVEHTYDGGTVVFPDGHIITQSGWDQDSKRTPEEMAAFHIARYKVGAEDNSFVLTQLEKLNSGGLPDMGKQFKGRLDTARVGALGHSLGGMISVTTCHYDKRFKTCINLDGGLDSGATYGLLTQPVVAMYGDRRVLQRVDETPEAFARRKASDERFDARRKSAYVGASASTYFVLVDSPGFSHFSYYDLPDSQAEVPPWRTTPDQWERNKEIIRAFTLATFNSYLRSKASNPFSALLRAYPEVNVELIGSSKRGH